MKQRKAGSAWDLLTPAERERRLVYQRASSTRRYRAMRDAQGFAPGQRKPSVSKYNRSDELREFVINCKIAIGQCSACKLLCEEWNYCMFAFDHLDPTLKLFALSKAPRIRGITKQIIADEIAKCQLLCHNCHAVFTWVHRDHDYKGHKIDLPVIASLLDCPEWDVA